MLVKFTVGNFLSIKDRVTLNLSATSISEFRTENVSESSVSDLKMLKAAVLYGANASGKSNLFKALKFVKYFILGSSKDSQADEELGVEPFRLSTSTIDQPSFFELELLIGSFKYRYGFEVDNFRIHKEWLYRQKKVKEYCLFTREGEEISSDGKFQFDENLKNLIRENALVLSVSAQFNGEVATEFIKHLRQIKFIAGSDDSAAYLRTLDLLQKPDFNARITNFMSCANLGFDEIITKKIKLSESMLPDDMPQELRKLILKDREEETLVHTVHTVYDENNNPVDKTYFSLTEHESLGARKFFSLSGPIIEALHKGSTLIIDEFDSRLHPVLSKAIVQLFNSTKDNPYKAQLIFATHNSSLLNAKFLRRDQIVLLKKGEFGSTKLNTLYDLKIRKDASYEKDYLLGKYEAVPKIEFTSQLNLFEQIGNSQDNEE